MTLSVIGAGLGRTGTTSLKYALELLLEAPCYHMKEVFQRPEHIASWHSAARGEKVLWQDFFEGYSATVDWPSASFWHEVSKSFPNALIVLSVRDSDSWWRSASTTIFPEMQRSKNGAWREMMHDLFKSRFTLSLNDKDACVAAYDRHLAEVRKIAPTNRLLEWSMADGWEPLCDALHLPIPDVPFPHANSKEDFASRQ